MCRCIFCVLCIKEASIVVTDFPLFADKRIMDSQVSGSINVNLSASVENDPVIAPFHDQYMKLHEVGAPLLIKNIILY